MKVHSLTRRVVMAVIAVELFCAAISSGVALWHEWGTRMHAVDAVLQGRSDSLLGAVQDAEDPDDNVYVDPVELRLPEEDHFAVYNQGGAALGGSERNGTLLTRRAGDGVRSMQLGGRPYRVLEREALRIIDRSENGGVGLRRPVTIVYAAPLTHVWREILEAAGFYTVVSLLLAIVTAVLLAALLHRLLLPLGHLAAAAARISSDSLSFQAPESATQVTELRPLAIALSETVERLHEAFEKEHRFVGDAAHELKTAVAVVRSSIQVLNLRSRPTDEYRQGLDQLLTDNERVEELVSRMLSLARLEERPVQDAEPIDLARTVDEAVRGLVSFATARGVELHTELTSNACTRIPAEAARTVVSNLVVNAIQHSAASSIVVVRVFPGNEGEPWVLLEVQDSGTGIESTDLPHVFERFYRADASRSRETGGAGLGLAISRGLVQAAGGQIALDSTVGQGTRATVRLPRASPR